MSKLLFALGLLMVQPLPRAEAQTVFIGGVGSDNGQPHACFHGMRAYGLREARGKVSSIVSYIEQTLAAGKGTVKIVGHSSGAVVAERIALKVNSKYRSRIQLVELDGIGSLEAQSVIPHSSCWYAKGRGKLHSRNASSMVQCNHPHAITNNSCRSQWCLHFALVNPHPPAFLRGDNFIKLGYEGCGGTPGW